MLDLNLSCHVKQVYFRKWHLSMWAADASVEPLWLIIPQPAVNTIQVYIGYSVLPYVLLVLPFIEGPPPHQSHKTAITSHSITQESLLYSRNNSLYRPVSRIVSFLPSVLVSAALLGSCSVIVCMEICSQSDRHSQRTQIGDSEW